MSTVPKIESHNLSVAELFKDFYSVPDFQREYVWKTDNVKKLFYDIVEELYDDDEPDNDSEYFLGSIVVFRDESGTFQLVDGQQRLTTIYMFFCAIRDLLCDFEYPTSRTIEERISGVAQDPKTGFDILRLRVTLQYGAGAKALSIIASREEEISSIDKGILSSVQDLVNAYEVLKGLISERFVPDVLLKFSSVFANKVKLIRIETPSFKNALKVFETINDRGIGLNSMDLLKNYLFINTASSNSIDNVKNHWQSLKSRWDKLTKILHKCQEDPMRFLRYYIMSHYEVDLQNNFPEESIYDWVVKENDQHQINKNPLSFVDKLIEASEHHLHFIKGENIDGSSNPYLKNITKLQGRYSQHFILLLAGRYLPKDLFVRLCYWVENLLFIYTITRSTRKDVNMIRTFSQWSKNIRAIKEVTEFNNFVKNSFQKEIASLSSDFDLTFRELTDSKIAKFRIKYILAKMTQFVNEKAYSNPTQLDEYLDKSLTIEHILPKSTKSGGRHNFNKPTEYNLYASKLGNLLLLEKSINSSISDSPFEDKKNGYAQSQFLLTRSLVGNNKVGNNTQINRTIKLLNLKHFDSWNSSTIDERQEILVN
ncbi:MAG: DUF262 domain-containing protein [Pseudanabaena sp. M090S1SP1A06QC]|jgi:uncharacterized protein with ParB-like and HNH nuclease domain|nr:DUF262 domain-containing protein [Pseudanabaena sp. M090S1SP1A06QC]MCA6621784.1 DUF262 domain-containing protein [Pseudanabaena sp. M165S2SP1A06QC]MCE2975622.1 DUF262 domain-containing HNH endonuclease family protein [Pseudanabaena sp. CoA8_M7]